MPNQWSSELITLMTVGRFEPSGCKLLDVAGPFLFTCVLGYSNLLEVVTSLP